jgi:hypothetical protein
MTFSTWCISAEHKKKNIIVTSTKEFIQCLYFNHIFFFDTSRLKQSTRGEWYHLLRNRLFMGFYQLDKKVRREKNTKDFPQKFRSKEFTSRLRGNSKTTCVVHQSNRLPKDRKKVSDTVNYKKMAFLSKRNWHGWGGGDLTFLQKKS